MIEMTPVGDINHYFWYDANGNLTSRIRQVPWAPKSWTYSWDVQDRLIKVVRDLPGTSDDRRVEYRYCPSCGGALTERIEYNATTGGAVLSWLRYEYEGLNLLRIDERYDNDSPPNGIDASDPWRPMNVSVHAPGAIGQIIKARWYKYDSTGANPMTPCDTGEYYYLYDAVGNVIGVLEDGTRFYRWEMDAFGNSAWTGDGMSGNTFLPMNHPGPKEHLTGKLFDTTTGLYYFHARWYDPLLGRFVSRDPIRSHTNSNYIIVKGNPLREYDPDGALPRSIETSECNSREQTDEWNRILKRSREANQFNNTIGHNACGQRADVIAHEIAKEGKLCCYDIAVMTRRTSPTYISIYHTVTVVRLRTKPSTYWDHYLNMVIDDWQTYTAFTGWGYHASYWMRSYLNEYPHYFMIVTY